MRVESGWSSIEEREVKGMVDFILRIVYEESMVSVTSIEVTRWNILSPSWLVFVYATTCMQASYTPKTVYTRVNYNDDVILYTLSFIVIFTIRPIIYNVSRINLLFNCHVL